MATQDECPIHPSMLKVTCSCKWRVYPPFSLERWNEKDDEVEVLRYGCRIPAHGSRRFHFRVRGAQMLIACLDELRGFVHSSEFNPPPTPIESQEYGLRVQILKHHDFIVHGELVDVPWLSLQELSPDNEPYCPASRLLRLNLGPTRCKAICYLGRGILSDWIDTGLLKLKQ